MEAVETLESVIQWNRVEDELPDLLPGFHFRQSEYLIVVSNGYVIIGLARESDRGIVWATPDSVLLSNVTLWSKLPYPPPCA